MLNIEFIIAEKTSEYKDARNLFENYANSLSFDLNFQDFAEELELMDKKYTYPDGALIIGYLDKQAIGCVAVRKLSENIAELKRLYVEPNYRSLKIGVKLMDLAIEKAKQLRYNFIRLDTVAEMKSAINLYKKLGFYEINPYCYNPIETAIYMEKQL